MYTVQTDTHIDTHTHTHTYTHTQYTHTRLEISCDWRDTASLSIIFLNFMPTFLCVCVCVCVSVCLCECVFVREWVSGVQCSEMWRHTHIINTHTSYTLTHIHAHLYIHIHTPHTRTHTSTYTYTHTIHTHTHTLYILVNDKLGSLFFTGLLPHSSTIRS